MSENNDAPNSTIAPPGARGWAIWRRAPFVAAVRLAGPIGMLGLRGGGLTLASLERPLERAFTTKRAKAVALLVNSPGGSAVQSAMIAARIRALAVEHEKPVLAFVEDVAASGGYWLALAADEIFVDASSIVGSIGVVSAGFGFDRMIGRLGIERRVHTAGERKAMLDPFRAEREEDLEVLREIQLETHARFKTEVRQRRGAKLRGQAGDELLDGRVWTGAKAVELGFADALGEPRTVLRQRYGARTSVRVLNQPRRRLLDRLGFRPAATEIVQELLQTAEERMLLQRLGL